MDKQTKTPGVTVDVAELVSLSREATAFLLPKTKRVSTLQSGDLISSARGRGIDFAEVREYQAGDDIRFMDWRVTARTGSAHTRLYHEEKERPVYVVVDFSESMHFGSRGAFKSVVAARAAALIAWAAVANGDRIGALVFSGETHQELRPRGNKRGVLPLLNTLSQFSQAEPQANTPDSLTQALLRLRRVTKPGSVILLFSDFMQVDQTAVPHLMQLAKHNKVACNLIYDPLEQTPPPPGRYGLSNGREFIHLNTRSKALREQYTERFETQLANIQSLCLKFGMPFLQLSAQMPLAQKLSRVFP